jgi:hypothetical protein
MLLCSHPERRHWCVHEAGHAVAAVEHGLPIQQVAVLDQPVAFGGGDRWKSGGLTIAPPKLRALRDAGIVSDIALFEVAVAGESAEKALLGHEVPGGARGDLEMFFGWMPHHRFLTVADYEPVLGESLDSARARMVGWARERTALIEGVATALDHLGYLSDAQLRTLGVTGQ